MSNDMRVELHDSYGDLVEVEGYRAAVFVRVHDGAGDYQVAIFHDKWRALALAKAIKKAAKLLPKDV